MKVQCERCSAQYDVDEKRIPASGLTMKCPACMHTFSVKVGAPAPPPPAAPALGEAGLELSAFEDADEMTSPRVMASGPPGPPPGPPGPPPPRPAAAPPPPPASAASMSMMGDELDLPAPVSRPGGGTIMGMAPPPMPPPPLPPPPRFDAFGGEDILDLPAPAMPRQDILDLPAPVSPTAHTDLPAPRTHTNSGVTFTAPDADLDLPAPKGESGNVGYGLDLDAPEADDLSADGLDLELAPKDSSSSRYSDLPAPKSETMDMAPKFETMDMAPKLETMDMAPKLDSMEMTPKGPGEQAPPPRTPSAAGQTRLGMAPPPMRAAPPDAARASATAPTMSAMPSLDEASLDVGSDGLADMLESGDESSAGSLASAPTAVTPRGTASSASSAPEAGKKVRPKWFLPVVAAGATTVVVAGIAVVLGVAGPKIFGRKSAELEGKLAAARKLLSDDTLASYKKAARDIEGGAVDGKLLPEAAGLAAQAHYSAARLGATAEIKLGDGVLQPIDAEPPEGDIPDLEKARALKSLANGRSADARNKLGAILSRAPSDALALVYLGWTELDVGDAIAADRAFSKAVSAEPSRAQALYGLGVAKERIGEPDAAKELYKRALARSPQHFGAAVGKARTEGGEGAAARAALEELIAKRGASVGPFEVADAWVTLGISAQDSGRRDEAEDRLGRAVALQPESSRAKVALARVLCDANKCVDALALVKKVAGSEPQNVDAQLTYLQVLLATDRVDDARDPLAQAVKLAPKSPRVLYWQGRSALAQVKPDRDEAIARFKDAIAGDARFTEAYLALSQTYAQMGKPEDGLAVLKDAESKAVDDPEFQTKLGEAYLALAKPVEAEARFRQALDKSPDTHAARLSLGQALEAQGKVAEAQQIYEELSMRAATYPGLAERQGRLAAKQGRYEEADRLFDAALKQGVPTRSLRLAAASTKQKLGKSQEVRKLAESVVKEEERSAEGHLLIAQSQYDMRLYDEALMEARRASSISDLPEAHLIQGQILEKMNKLEQSNSEYQLARRPPVEGEAGLGRARILIRLGAPKDALVELVALSKLGKLKGETKMIEADCYADLQQPDRARKAYEEAVKYAPELGEAWFKLGRSRKDAAQRKPAIEALEKSIKLGESAPYAAEANLLLGDAHREGHENEPALKAYQRYLELAPANATMRTEVQKQISLLNPGK